MPTPDLNAIQHREFHVRAANPDAREFTGIGVPWNTEIEMFGGMWREKFHPGSVENAETALILWRHDDPIGRVTTAEETEDGMQITGKLSDTERGREAYQLLKDGVITRMSIGFEPLEYTIDETDDTDAITYTRVRAHEFSLVPFPAYDSAKVTSVRHNHERPPMTTTLTRKDLAEELATRDEKLEDFERSLARIEANTHHEKPAGTQWRTMGAFLKALATGDEKAAEFHRAYAGGTEADDVLRATPVGEFIKWVEARLTTINMFTRGTLPPTGNTVEFVRMPALPKGPIIDKQAKEGKDLVGPFKIKLEDGTAPIETWGGWTELSRQRIERSQHNYLDKVLRVMGLEWARYAESRFKDYLKTKLTERAGDALSLPATPDYTDYLGAIIDAGDYYSAHGYSLDGLALSPDKFKALALIEAADGRPLMSVYGSGINTTGELNLPKGHGNLAGVPVSVLWDTEGLGTFFDKSALEIDLSPGAPAQLQDENIINLTKQFSVYGYAAMYDPFPGGLLPLSTEGAPGE